MKELEDRKGGGEREGGREGEGEGMLGLGEEARRGERETKGGRFGGGWEVEGREVAVVRVSSSLSEEGEGETEGDAEGEEEVVGGRAESTLWVIGLKSNFSLGMGGGRGRGEEEGGVLGGGVLGGGGGGLQGRVELVEREGGGRTGW